MLITRTGQCETTLESIKERSKVVTILPPQTSLAVPFELRVVLEKLQPYMESGNMKSILDPMSSFCGSIFLPPKT